MAQRNFPGQTADWLRAKLVQVNEELAAGKISTGSNAGDLGFQFQREASLKQRQQDIIWDLNIVEPGGEWLQHLRPSQTVGRFPSFV